jgi:hypothetical protein
MRILFWIGLILVSIGVLVGPFAWWCARKFRRLYCFIMQTATSGRYCIPDEIEGHPKEDINPCEYDPPNLVH